MRLITVVLLTLLLTASSFLPAAQGAVGGGNNPIISYLSFHDANLKDVLYLLAKRSGLNIVLDERAMNLEKEPKRITINLTNVPVYTALDLVVSSAGLTYAKVGNAIVVGEKNELGRNFNFLVTERVKLQYADAFKVKDTLVGLGITDYNNIFVYGELNKELENNSQEKDRVVMVGSQQSSNNGSSQSPSSSQGNEGNTAANLTVSKLTENRIKETDKANAVAANILVIRDTLANISRMKEVIKALDQPAPKIMVEAKVIEISESGMKNLGVDWLTTDTSTSDKILGKTTLIEDPSPIGNIGIGRFARSGLSFNAVIKAQIDQGNAKLLSSPKIATLEGKPAFIYVGDKVPYISARNIDNENKQITTEVSFLNAGVTLEILPLLAEGQEIQLKIYSEVSSIKDWVTIDNIKYPEPSMRQAQTITRVKAGESIILGGLIYDDEKKTMSKLPILGDLPILKSLFSWTNSSRDRTEVVISLTPYIVK